MNKDIINKKYGRLTVLSFDKEVKFLYYYNCKCECGNIKSIRYDALKSGATKSCGCLQKETIRNIKITHGLSRTLTYKSWSSMMQRCFNANNTNYKDYGGRGIIVCERWLIYENFLEDMGSRPDKLLSIDRIDTDGNYELSNCKWSTQKEQNINRRNSKSVVNTITNQEYFTISEAAIDLDISISSLHKQLTGKNKNKTDLKLKN